MGITDGNEYINKTRVSKIPSQMIGFWENRNNPHIWTTRGPVRTFLEITEEGLSEYGVKVYYGVIMNSSRNVFGLIAL